MGSAPSAEVRPPWTPHQSQPNSQANASSTLTYKYTPSVQNHIKELSKVCVCVCGVCVTVCVRVCCVCVDVIIIIIITL